MQRARGNSIAEKTNRQKKRVKRFVREGKAKRIQPPRVRGEAAKKNRREARGFGEADYSISNNSVPKQSVLPSPDARLRCGRNSKDKKRKEQSTFKKEKKVPHKGSLTGTEASAKKKGKRDETGHAKQRACSSVRNMSPNEIGQRRRGVGAPGK